MTRASKSAYQKDWRRSLKAGGSRLEAGKPQRGQPAASSLEPSARAACGHVDSRSKPTRGVPTPRRVLVTGGAGFVGAWLVRRLVEKGFEVHLVLRDLDPRWRLVGWYDRLRVHCGDLLDVASLHRVIAKAQPHLVYHLAADGGSIRHQKVERILTTNIMGTWNLLKACQESPCELLVHAGSSSEYGFQDKAMRETDLIAPNSYYAVSKAAATHLCQYVATQVRFPMVTLRLFSVYGPYEEPSRLFPTIIRRALLHQPLLMASPDAAHDFIYVDDAAAAFLRIVALRRLRAEVINIGTGIQSTLAQVVKVVLEVTGSKSPVHWNAVPRRAWDSKAWVGSISKARRLLKWRPAHSLREGVQKTAEWISTQGSSRG